MSLEKVKCSYCGYVYWTDVKRKLEDGRITVVRGKKANVSKTGCEEYTDLKCPNCGEEDEWQVK